MSRLFPGLKVLSSMRLRIGLLYLALSVVNIVILTAMIFENQLDMLRLNFRLQSDRIAGTVLTRLEELDPSRIDDLNTLDRVLNENHIISYVIFTERGDKLFEKAKEASVLPATGQIEEPVRRSVLQLRPTALIRQRYTIELNESDYSAQYTMSLPGGRFEQPGYIHAIMRIADFEARYRLLYRQAALAAGLVFLAHLIFALIAIRIFFRRIGLLAHASEHLAEGNLAARASWTMNRMDEVDLLGTTFNHMAQKIQSTVDALSGLNTEIQNELTIGKEVQEQFLPDAKSLAKWNAAAISRPLRE
ncbi:MAG TPA: HAMP domain-containing protein, partial [Leptospiraceae bacterium]|nr:HAMP domain-containing protein [Leptospiraceae bacterium]